MKKQKIILFLIGAIILVILISVSIFLKSSQKDTTPQTVYTPLTQEEKQGLLKEINNKPQGSPVLTSEEKTKVLTSINTPPPNASSTETTRPVLTPEQKKQLLDSINNTH